MTEGTEFLKPETLFNLLNQEFKYPSISDPVYMLLLDARLRKNYDESHIVTAKFVSLNDKGQYLIAEDYELSCKTFVIVYDLETSVVNFGSRSFKCAKQMWKYGSRNQVKILEGGYKLFSSMYPFLRTRKIIYLPRELDMFQTYPCEVIRRKLYLGRRPHANMAYIQRDLKIDRHINCGVCPSMLYPDVGRNIMNFNVRNTADCSFYTKIQAICDFIDLDYSSDGAVLVYSEYGTNRSAAVVVAYLIYIRMCSYESALALLKSYCPKVCICRRLSDQLEIWARDIEANPFAIKRKELAVAAKESIDIPRPKTSTYEFCDEVASSTCIMQTMQLREHEEDEEEEEDDEEEDEEEDEDADYLYKDVLETLADKKLDEEEKEDDDEGSLDFMPGEEVLIRTIDAKEKSGSMTVKQEDKDQVKSADKDQDKYGDKDQDKYGDKDQDKSADKDLDKYGDKDLDKYGEEFDEEETEEFIEPVEKEFLVKSVRSLHSIKHIPSQRGRGGSAMKSVFSFRISRRKRDDDWSSSHVDEEIDVQTRAEKTDEETDEEEIKVEEKEEP